MGLDEVRPSVSFPELELEILAFWESRKIFERSLDQNSSAPVYSFYDGPPFATGLPHYGHLLAGTLKDIIPRYWTMRGYRVDRRFGWDCHGLPVEYEIDQKLGLKGSKEIERYGIARYNEECRSIVQRYTREWERTVRRVGRWVSFERGYRTMDREFMESVWWVFNELWKQGLIYRGFKVLHFSTALSTELSNFEASLNYKEVDDPAIIVEFPLEEDPTIVLLAWTTTPWTLPSNLALAVGADIEYTLVRVDGKEKRYLVADALIDTVFKGRSIERIRTLSGRSLSGKSYAPLFPYFSDLRKKGAFQVRIGAHVETGVGTGIVHIAPGFGEEDFELGRAAGLPPVCPVDEDGKFTAELPEFQGQYVKEADREIIRVLKANGRLFQQGILRHSYPFCWRTDTPLIYRAVETWFVNVERLKERLIAHNKSIRWVPDHVGSKRFEHWLENARDWAISRNRFWGTPLPIWVSEDGKESHCVGSIEELQKLAGRAVTDLHREFIDDIQFDHPNKPGVRLRRIPAVLDCWFESGSMPYAQLHYPFDNQEQFKRSFPADFIAEGLDQTRGWFYTLTILSTALFDRPAFKNVIVNGLVLAEDGKKMSKRLKNYPEPDVVLADSGGDALRLYLINSPVIRAEELRFSEDGVRDIVRRVLLPWWNAYSFLVTYARVDGFKPAGIPVKPNNILDRWILSRLNSMLKFIETEMEAYRLFTVVPFLLQFIDELTNTYIRLNRRRYWESEATTKQAAYETLYFVLLTVSRVMAPFAPFLSEATFRNLRNLTPDAKESVHLEPYPRSDELRIDRELERAVREMNEILVLGRRIRNDQGIKVKIPLKSLRVVHRDPALLEGIRAVEPYIREELNVRRVEFDAAEATVVKLSAKANPRVLGKRLQGRYKEFDAAIRALAHDQVLRLEEGHSIEILGEPIASTEVEIERRAHGDRPDVATNRLITIVLDLSIDEDQRVDGMARELVARLQQVRKEAELHVSDRVRVRVVPETASSPAAPLLAQALSSRREYISEECLIVEWADEPIPSAAQTGIEIEGATARVEIARV